MYEEEAVQRLLFIKGVQRLGLRLREVRELLDIVDRGRCPCGHTETLVSRKGDRYRRGDRATVRSEEGRPRGSDFKIRDPIQANGRASNSSWRREVPDDDGPLTSPLLS